MQTPTTTSSRTSSRKERSNIDDVNRSLQNHSMYFDDKAAWNIRCKDFKDHVMKSFLSDRHSEMQPHSHKRCTDALDETRFSNGATFHKVVLPSIFLDHHTVTTNKRSLEGDMILVVQSYAKEDGLMRQERPKFAIGFVPGNEDTVKALGLTEPNPDTVWGKEQPLFLKPGTLRPSDIKVIKSMGCTVDWPFFIFESKPSRGAVADARNQAQRDCGAILKSLLKLKEYVEGRGYKKKIGAIEDFWIFSLCWNPDFANILVHWVEVLPGETVLFHSTKVGQKFLDEEEGRAKLRACGHNIFDHGLFNHVPALEKMWAKAVEAEKPFDDDFDLYN